MPQSEFERLFLLEFYVDEVYIRNSSIVYPTDQDEQREPSAGQLSVSLQFFYYPPMTVCEEDFTPITKPLSRSSNVIFKSGKSCLFSLRSSQHPVKVSSFDVNITIYQKIPKDKGDEGSVGSEKVYLGKAVISLVESFTNLMNNSTDASSSPLCSVTQDIFQIINDSGKEIGTVKAFIRLSCFGKLIVTQFQLGGDENEAYMFKGTDNNEKLFKGQGDSEMISYEETDFELEREIPGETPYHDIFGYEASEEGPGYEDFVDEEESEIMVNKGAKEKSNIKEEENIPPEEDYKEIGAEINGHSLTIRVLKKRKKTKKSIVQEETSKQENNVCSCSPPESGDPCPYAPKLNVCDCDYPLPPELIPRCPPPKCAPCCHAPCAPPGIQSGTNQSNTPVNPSELEPGMVVLKGDQVIFQMQNRQTGEPVSKRDKKFANSLYYKLNSSDGKEGVKNYVQITPQCQDDLPLDAGGPVSGLPPDSKQEVFLLKVQKASVNVDNKSKLEMELRTPKPKEPKPETESKNTQYLLSDAPMPEKRAPNRKKKKK